MASKTIKIVHASGEVFDDYDQARNDIRSLIQLQAVILCGTESGDEDRRKMIEFELGDDGYHTFVPSTTDGWIAVHRNFVGHSPVSMRYNEVLPPAGEVHDPHPYNGKGVIQVGFTHPTLGRITVVGGGHYLTQGRYAGQAQEDIPGDPVHHREANKKLAHAMADACIAAAKGSGIAFFTADTNMVDREDDVFFGKPLTTCWDEMGKWPDTGHGNIDVIGSVDADNRVKCMEAVALGDDAFPQHSDHNVIEAWYKIRKLNPDTEGTP